MWEFIDSGLQNTCYDCTCDLLIHHYLETFEPNKYQMCFTSHKEIPQSVLLATEGKLSKSQAIIK